MQFPKIFLAFFIGSTVASLTLDERMDWAAEDPKGMYSSNKITKSQDLNSNFLAKLIWLFLKF